MGKARTNVILLDNLTAINGQYVNVLTYLTPTQIADVVGGVGSLDVTAGFNQALATGLQVWAPKGTYLITDKLLFAYPGQILQGSGRVATVLKITNAFNMAALGVCVATCGEEGPHLRDFGINFIQPDTAVRANLVAYPPAIYFRDTPRFTIQNMRIACAMTGIDMKGNSGGAFIDTLELSAFNIHIDIDGCLDSVRLNNVHCWDFGSAGVSGMTANQLTIYQDNSTVGLKVGTCDDLHIVNGLFISKGKQIWMHAGVGGIGPFGTVSTTDFDSYASIVCEVGQLTFSSCFFSVGGADTQLLIQTGGWLKFGSCEFEAATQLTNPMFSLTGNGVLAASPVLHIANSLIRLGLDMTVIQANATLGSSNVMFMNNMVMNGPNVAYTKPTIWIKAGARLTAIGNRITDKGTGAATFMKIDVDDEHVVMGNVFTGWDLDVPSTQAFGIYQGNVGLFDAIVNGNLEGPQRVKRLTGTLDGSGAATIAHGLPSAQLKVLSHTAYYKNGTSGATPLTVSSIDGTDVFLTGGSTTLAPCRVTLYYSESPQSPW